MSSNLVRPQGTQQQVPFISKGTAAAGARLGPRPESKATPASTGAWRNADSTNALKSALNTARNPSLAPRPQSIMLKTSATPSAVANQFSRLEVSGVQKQDWRSTKVYDPSLGPTRSMMTTNWRSSTVGSNVTGRTGRQVFQNAVCTLSNFSRSDFHQGDVIAAPFHVANTNPNASPSDPRLVKTVEGFAYSKRRMLVVLFVYSQDMYCLPLYSFGNRGLEAKPEALRKEYVCTRNEGEEEKENPGVHRAVVIRSRRPLTESTTIHLTGGIRVGCNEDITSVGRLTKQSYGELVDIWGALVQGAQGESW